MRRVVLERRHGAAGQDDGARARRDRREGVPRREQEVRELDVQCGRCARRCESVVEDTALGAEVVEGDEEGEEGVQDRGRRRWRRFSFGSRVPAGFLLLRLGVRDIALDLVRQLRVLNVLDERVEIDLVDAFRL